MNVDVLVLRCRPMVACWINRRLSIAAVFEISDKPHKPRNISWTAENIFQSGFVIEIDRTRCMCVCVCVCVCPFQLWQHLIINLLFFLRPKAQSLRPTFAFKSTPSRCWSFRSHQQFKWFKFFEFFWPATRVSHLRWIINGLHSGGLLEAIVC